MIKKSDQRAKELFQQVIVPLVCGGPLVPCLPIGPKLGQEIASTDRDVSAYDQWLRFEMSRVRRARQLCPVDTLEPLSRDQWLMAVAFSDLLQCVNPELDNALTDRAQTLFEGVQEVLTLVSAPRTAAEALSRHASFARVFETERLDTEVSWWCGAAVFRGREPPKRMLTWPELRRVNQSKKRVELAKLCSDAPQQAGQFAQGLRALLEHSPLSDLATSTRATPSFEFSESIFALMSTASGWTLGVRALLRNGCANAIAVVKGTSTRGLATDPRFRDQVKAIVDELQQREQLAP